MVQRDRVFVGEANLLLVSKGGTRGSADQAVFGQLSNYPCALFVAATLMALLAVMPGLPALVLPAGTEIAHIVEDCRT